MFVTNKEEVESLLRSRLSDYLVLHGIKEPNKSKFNCIVHSETNPSMVINPKTNGETAHCFSCNTSIDIFAAANIIEGLPMAGPEWITETMPKLAKQLKIDIALGEPSALDKAKSDLYRLARDASDIIQHPGNSAKEYIAQRSWANDYEDCYVIEYQVLLDKLLNLGWDKSFIEQSRLICIPVEDTVYPLVGLDKVTCIIRDHRNRPVAFISRNLDPNSPRKYIHSAESLIYRKNEVLYGLDRALATAKRDGLILVEGPGDRFQYLRFGIQNVAALCGTALTDSHLNLLKLLGISSLYFSLDWDEAGQNAIERILAMMASKKISGFNIFIAEKIDNFKDVDEYCVSSTTANARQIKFIEMFEWVVRRVDIKSEDDIQNKLIPIIASAPSAVKRDILANKLSQIIGVSSASILADAERIRNHSYEQRRDRLLASADKYRSTIEADPTNMISALASHEEEVEKIETDYDKNSLGVNYQLSRFDSLQELKKTDDIDRSEFNLQVYTDFKKAMSGGTSWTRGCLIYFGGRANSGKTATITAIGLDACINDPDTIVIAHLTDDDYAMLEPRLITITSFILSNTQKLSIGAAAAPSKNITTSEASALYNRAVTQLRGLIAEERLIVLDSEDGNTLSVLEKTIKYARRKYPNKKILVLADNTHNYSDFGNLDQTGRITRISDAQKRIVNVYKCCMFATAEYRKNMPLDSAKLKYPVNDDLADARALMFRAGVIIHVYNDLNDRAEAAEIFWTDPSDPEEPLPQLLLMFGKNKINKFKKKLIMNLDIDTVTMRQISAKEAADEWDRRNNGMSIENGKVVIATDYEDEDE